MNLIKAIRKNQTKIMGVALIIIMIGFIGGYYLQRMVEERDPNKAVIATFGKDYKITGHDMISARNQLDVLKELGLNAYLNYGSIQQALIGDLLFSESSSSERLHRALKEMTMRGQLPLDPSLIESFFESNQGRSQLYWILLSYEADKAGCAVTRDQAIAVYKQLAPAMFGENADPSKIVASMSSRHQISQETIMDIVARLLSITAYVDTMCQTQNNTLPEIEATVGFETEKISAQYVKFAAEDFADQIKEVSEDELNKQFDSYKDKTAGVITNDNPYGFGYMVPAAVQLEYIIIKTDELAQAVQVPSAEEMEEYYQMNKSSFTEQVPSDPTNPESEKISRTKTYAEVASSIKQKLVAERRDSKAEIIINEAADMTSKNLFEKDTESMTSDDFKKYAGDFASSAQELSKKYNINVYTGKTGYLSMDDFQKDSNLSLLAIQRGNAASTMLSQLVFSANEIATVKLNKFEGAAPKLYQNIGPLKSMYGNTLAVIRIIDAKQAHVPQSIDDTYDITASSLKAGETATVTKAVKDAVIKDCKLLGAMNIAQSRAEAFINTAGQDWDKAIEANKKDLKNLKLSKLEDQGRVSQYSMINLDAQLKSFPGQSSYLKYKLSDKMLKDSLYKIADEQMPQVIELKSDMSYYAVKKVDIKAATDKDFDDNKFNAALGKSAISSMQASLIQLNADNIISRTGYEEIKAVEAVDEDADNKTNEEQE